MSTLKRRYPHLDDSPMVRLVYLLAEIEVARYWEEINNIRDHGGFDDENSDLRAL